MKGLKFIPSALGHHVGQRVKKQFPKSLNDAWGGRNMTTIIEGTIEKIWETRNGAYATVLQDDGKRRLVVLG